MLIEITVHAHYHLHHYSKGPSSYAAAIGGNDSDVTPQRASQEYASWNERESESSSELYNLTSHSVATKTGGLPLALATADTPLCPFFANDIPFCDETCKHLHGDICDMCGMPKLHPLNAQKKEEHTRVSGFLDRLIAVNI